MTAGRRRPRDPEATRQALLDAAIELFGRDGFDGTPVSAIAEAAQVTKGGFYHHFPSKQALLYEIHDRFIDDHLLRMRALMAADVPADELLRRLVRDVLLEGAARFRDDIEIFYQERRQLEGEAYDAVLAKRHEFEQVVVDVVRRGIDEGVLRDAGNAKLVAFGIIGMTMWAYHWFDPSRGWSAAAVGDMYARDPAGRAAGVRLEQAVQSANVPTLIPLLVMLTGDLRWLEEPYRPRRNRGLDDNHDGGLPPAIGQEIRDAAAAAIRDEPVLRAPSPALLVRMLSVAMGERVPDEYGPMIASELGLGAPMPAPAAVPQDFNVLILGAGISGLAAAIRLQEAGIPFSVLERAETVGGTWLVNRYPGAGVDTPSALYSFSFAQQRLVALLRAARRAARVPRAGRRARALGDPVRDRGARRGLRRRRPGVGGRASRRRDAAGQRPAERGRRVRAPEVAGDLEARPVRRSVRAHRALAGRPVARRQARRRDRQRRERDAARPGRRRRRRVDRDLPALAAVGGAVRPVPDARCPRRTGSSCARSRCTGSGTGCGPAGRSTTASTRRCRRTRRGRTPSAR